MCEITHVDICQCEAVTITFENGATNSMPEQEAQKYVSDLQDKTPTVIHCDYCVNKWGTDLCGCGSGEKVGECDNDYHECINNIPAQTLYIKKEFLGWR